MLYLEFLTNCGLMKVRQEIISAIGNFNTFQKKKKLCEQLEVCRKDPKITLTALSSYFRA